MLFVLRSRATHHTTTHTKMSGHLGNVLMGPECHPIIQLFTMVWSRDPRVGSMYYCL